MFITLAPENFVLIVQPKRKRLHLIFKVCVKFNYNAFKTPQKHAVVMIEKIEGKMKIN